MKINRGTTLLVPLLLVVYSSLTILFTTSACANQSPYQGQHYIRETLFSVDIGTGLDQIGITVPETKADAKEDSFLDATGPVALTVDGRGNIYIADCVNQCVKVFNREGKFQRRTDKDLSNLSHILVDRDNNIFTLSGSALDTLTKFGTDGQRLWEIYENETLPAQLGGHFGVLYKAPGSSIAVYLTSSIGKPSSVTLNAQGQFQKKLEGSVCTAAGEVYSFDAVPERDRALRVNVATMDRKPLRSYVIEPDGEALKLYAGVGTKRLGSVRVDLKGNLYTVAFAKRDEITQVSPGLWSYTDTIIVRYNSDGSPISALRFPSGPFDSVESQAIDSEGNVYHLEIVGKTVQVARYNFSKVPTTK